jgi:hypothetical protein
MTEALPQATCPMCGGTPLECGQAIFDGMAMMAFLEVERHLSEEGIDALRMVMHTSETLPGGLKEAWELAENVEESLPAHELRAIETYLARWTLLDTARAELYDG